MTAERTAAMGRLIEEMRNCPQARDVSVLQHGEAVWATFQQLLEILNGRQPAAEGWRIPSWAYDPVLVGRLVPMEVAEEYAVFHDCGKPSTRQVDEQGRAHFHGHAAASEQVWLAAGGDPQAARLMAMDMDFHMLRPEGVKEFANRPEAPTLMLLAVAEVHSNASMFGGFDSDSFKIKAKHLAKRGRQVIQMIEAECAT